MRQRACLVSFCRIGSVFLCPYIMRARHRAASSFAPASDGLFSASLSALMGSSAALMSTRQRNVCVEEIDSMRERVYWGGWKEPHTLACERSGDPILRREGLILFHILAVHCERNLCSVSHTPIHCNYSTCVTKSCRKAAGLLLRLLSPSVLSWFLTLCHFFLCYVRLRAPAELLSKQGNEHGM